ncbi:hypothetical protein HanXRQr2_Chr13g0590851 [Helianthus annuus]|uniref:Uncharacterized protein n=1 Tax=Helianthus annuus TaxID=4232 RepID=A0A251STF8_HELAN|nr:hypothetical protein HanXRQr2_Chr13g0590851 [Helianthus annuus]KAJ0497940.1 hypothetical protein HanHA89_Chr13g0516741 [Helianthus annuus]KAJ0663946.1 hypothetical protein HanLR1_Chr13g0486631 [Helianthus annuus]KAJ0849460.1 hypothetical protein HanPSC8_Chr13g0568981 [Helianthus annuus]
MIFRRPPLFPFFLRSNNNQPPSPFSSSINNRSTTTTVRWWCGGYNREREGRDREREKTGGGGERRQRQRGSAPQSDDLSLGPVVRISVWWSVTRTGGSCYYPTDSPVRTLPVP